MYRYARQTIILYFVGRAKAPQNGRPIPLFSITPNWAEDGYKSVTVNTTRSLMVWRS
jgi:hypothetical protein